MQIQFLQVNFNGLVITNKVTHSKILSELWRILSKVQTTRIYKDYKRLNILDALYSIVKESKLKNL